MVATLVVLFLAKNLKLISFPNVSKDTLLKIWPLPLFYLGNMLFGLGGTKELSLPMMTVLRRFSILMTMVGEFYILKVSPDVKVQLSVYLMIFGAIIAACNDLAFSLKVNEKSRYPYKGSRCVKDFVNRSWHRSSRSGFSGIGCPHPLL